MERSDVSSALDLLDRRRALILLSLMDGSKRFTALREALGGVGQKTLCSNLRILEHAGLLTRTVYAEVPPKVEYTLTEAGLSLRPVLDSLAGWSAKYLAGA